jgi:concentrative nucleoside transporter, CNT family
MEFARSLFGIFALLAMAWLVSDARGRVNWRLIFGGLALQVFLAAAFFQFGDFTQAIINPVAKFFADVTSFSDEGARMLFGVFVDDATMGKVFSNQGYIFAFRVLPTIIFFSALTSVLYYLGILQRIVYAFAWVMKRVMRLSGAESLAAAGEVFLGQTESALLIKPYLPKMTRSEILTLMVGGMATIAGGVMAAYIGMLSASDPAQKLVVARNLLCASLMNAPAAIVIAKLLVPERETINERLEVPREKLGSNVFDAASSGTTEGLHLALNVGAMLIAFVAFIYLINYFLGGIGQIPLGDQNLNQHIVSWSGGVYQGLSLQSILGTICAPLAWLIGVDGGPDLLKSGQLLGTKVALNEFIAYDQLGQMKGTLNDRTVFLMQFALCGFANISSIGIQLGGISTIAPEQRQTLAKLGLRALYGGTLATLLTAAVAGMFYGK